MKNYNPDKFKDSIYRDAAHEDTIIEVEATDENDKKEKKEIEGEIR